MFLHGMFQISNSTISSSIRYGSIRVSSFIRNRSVRVSSYIRYRSIRVGFCMLLMAWPINVYAFFLIGSYLITRLILSIYNEINLSNLLRFSIFLGSFPEPDVGLPKLGKTIFTFLFWYRIFTHSVFLGVADFYKLYKSAFFSIFCLFRWWILIHSS